MKKRILHLLNTSSFSGAENVVISIIEEAADCYEHIYASLDGSIRETLNTKDITFVPLKKMTVKEIKRICKLINPDVIHAHDYTSSIICAISGVRIPVISHLHNNAPWLQTYHPYSFLYALSSLRYKKVLTVSNSIMNEYVFGKYIVKKSLTIGNPVNVDKIVSESNEFNIPVSSFDIIFLGRLVPEKAPLKFIKLMKMLVEFKSNLSVAVIGEGTLKGKCEEKTIELGLEDNIEFLGFKSNPYPYLKSSKVLCMTSLWEGFGLVAVEALSLGVPVVAPPVGGLIDIVDDKCGLLTTNNNDYINELKRLICDKEYYMMKSRSAKSKSELFNNAKEYSRALEEIYDFATMSKKIKVK